jgi:hypothetical protein
VALPKGVPLYATIFTEVAGSWTRYHSITFTAGRLQISDIPARRH